VAGPIDHELIAIPETTCEVGLSEDDLEARVAEISALAAEQIHSDQLDADQASLRPLEDPSRDPRADPDHIRTVLRTWMPRRTVHVRAFAVDRTLVTTRQSAAFARETGARVPWASRPGGHRGQERHPVQVAHAEAFAYAT
jgi:formylglycine-generating enzyme required for sulfatase activity